MKKGAEWIPFYRSLRSGAKRGLPRAARFVYLELSMESRSYGGALPLPKGFRSDADAVHDILGGDRKEISKALTLLQEAGSGGENPMIVISGDSNSRVLTILKHREWVSGDLSTPRVHAFRERAKSQSEEERGLECPIETANENVGGGEEKRREEKRKEDKRRDTPLTPQGGNANATPIGPEPESGVHVVGAPLAHPPAKTGARRSRTADRGRKPETSLPDDFAVSPAIEAMCKAEKLPNPHVVIVDFRDKSIAKEYRYANWEAAFRAWMRSPITRKAYPIWEPKVRVPPRREDVDVDPAPIGSVAELPDDLFTGLGKAGGT